MSQQPFTFLMQGGLDLVTPKIAVKPGTLLACQNYESAERGYRRVDGIERFDGQLKPSEATYHYAPFTAGNTSLAAGQVVTGGTSAATGILVAAPTVTSGSYGASNAVGYAGVYVTSGTFQNGEGLQVGGVTKLTLSAAPTERGAPSDTIDAALLQAEIERRRALVLGPPGSGPVRGVWTYGGDVYCFRTDAGATTDVMFKATTGGWVAVDDSERVQFTTGTTEPLEGETLTRGGVTSTIVRVQRTSGTYGGGDAAGYITITGRSGGNYTNGVATSTSGSVTLTNAPQTAVTLGLQGKYRFRNYSFTGAASATRMFWTNEVAYAKEFDGTSYSQIAAPVPSVRPTNLAVHANHLWLGYETGNILYSSLGNPREFIAADDSGEIVFGSTLTGMQDGASTSLVLFGSDRISYVTGSSGDDFVMRDISSTSGAKLDSVVMVGQVPYFLDDRGVRRLDASQNFGDWSMGSVSELVAPLFASKAAAGVACTAAVAVKRKNQVRFFFDDASGVSVYLGRKYPEITTFTLPITVFCACAGEDETGNEVIFAGSTGGYVYQLDSGTSYHNVAIDAWMVPHFASPNGNASNKVWHGCRIECDAATSATEGITFVAEYSYGDGLLVPSAEGASSITGVGGLWDVMDWDQFIWDAPVQGTAWADLNGFGFNVSLAIHSELEYEAPHTISSMSFTYSQRGLIRGMHAA